MTIPKVGEKIQIYSYKHDGSVHRIWEETNVLKGTQNTFIGANDRTLVTEKDGRTWITREPAICYFHSDYWFNIIGMLRSDGVYYYCNISSPFIYFDGALKYIDYDLDVKVFPDMTYILLDEDEYEEHRVQLNYPKELDAILRRNIDILIQWIHERKGPFSPEFIQEWYTRFQQHKKGRKEDC